VDKSYHVARDNKLAVDSSPSEGYEDEGGYELEDVAVQESEQDEPEGISLPDKLMMGCAISTLIVPVILLVIALILFSLAQQS